MSRTERSGSSSGLFPYPVTCMCEVKPITVFLISFSKPSSIERAMMRAAVPRHTPAMAIVEMKDRKGDLLEVRKNLRAMNQETFSGFPRIPGGIP